MGSNQNTPVLIKSIIFPDFSIAQSNLFQGRLYSQVVQG